jgi:hypothetical protein
LESSVINVGAADGSKWAVLYHNPCDGDELEPGFHAARNLPKMDWSDEADVERERADDESSARFDARRKPGTLGTG